MKRAAIYARVSTDEQADNTSLDGQVELCRRYAENYDMEVVIIFREDFSGAYLEERPELARLLMMVRNREIDAVICKSSDRWSRDVSHTKSLKRILNRSGVELHYTNRGQSLNTPHGKFMDNMEGGFNEYWKDVLVELMANGKDNKARNEKRPVMSGHAPYGYRREGRGKDARYVIYEPEARTVRDIYEWYVYGNGDGLLSLRAIAGKLDRRGDLTPNNRKNAAEEWIPATVRGILANSIYAGVTYYGKSRKNEGVRVQQPREDWIEIPVPELALVSMELYNAAQERAQRNKALARRNQKAEYLLSGFFRCGSCGNAMAGTNRNDNGSIYYYYRCGNHWRSPEQRQCPNVNRVVHGIKAECQVWNWIETLLQDEQGLIDGIRKMIERSDDDVKYLRERLEIVNDMIEKADRKARRLMAQFGDEEEEQVVLDLVQDEISRTAKEKASFEADRKKLQAELAQRSITPDQEEELLRIAAELREELDFPDYETKKYILDRLNLQVVFHSEGERRWLVASCSLSAEPKEIRLRPSSMFSRH